MWACAVCGEGREYTELRAREMMFGYREEFLYRSCGRCGCLQLVDAPTDWARYYPPEYYAYRDDHWPVPRPGPLKRYLKAKRLDHHLGRRTLLGAVATTAFGPLRPDDPVLDQARAHGGLSSATPVLDVGCGRGDRLLDWSYYGFTDLTGVDPHVDRDLRYPSGVTVLRTSALDLDRRAGLILLSHSFEHMDRPGEVLTRLASLLLGGGVILLRIPLAASLARERYRENWVQLDAPRHLFLHTPASIRLLAVQSGLEVTDVVYDSSAFQFWGSEQYVRDIPLADPRSYAVDPDGGVFSPEEIRGFEEEARRLNAECRGDQACFVLRASRVA